jgi:hypothetical protein
MRIHETHTQSSGTIINRREQGTVPWPRRSSRALNEVPPTPSTRYAGLANGWGRNGAAALSNQTRIIRSIATASSNKEKSGHSFQVGVLQWHSPTLVRHILPPTGGSSLARRHSGVVIVDPLGWWYRCGYWYHRHCRERWSRTRQRRTDNEERFYQHSHKDRGG